jgi:superfamily II DNA or RNA helicase
MQTDRTSGNNSLVNVSYGQTGESKKTNPMGMRDMQARAFEHRNAQYLLVKAPPASGKSRALMFIGIDKVQRQGVRKVIVSVPERSIGSSFQTTRLTKGGFFADWIVEDQYNLCTRLGSASDGTVKTLETFLSSKADNLVCTHATLRYAIERLGIEAFEDICIAVDEFHHVSTDEDNVLGDQLRRMMVNDKTHIVAMTGSYFRGDSSPILMPSDEARFDKVTYTYYEQLNGYEYLRTLGIGYHFYRGTYLDAISEVLDTGLKTIIHIPNVRSAESTTEKYIEVDRIIDVLGEELSFDSATGIHLIKAKDGTILRVIDLVQEQGRDLAMVTVRSIENRDDVDIIIALNMGKEGFDWIWCEHALTVGYRGSLTEVIQIIGRTTRDAPGKTHARFTNLIAEPDSASNKVVDAVNNMLKAIACSLLMEQVLAPVFKFKARKDGDDLDGNPRRADDEDGAVGTIIVRGLKEPTSERARQIIATDLIDLKATILQHPVILKAALDPEAYSAEVINQALIPKVIAECYPDLDETGVEEVRQHFVADTVIRSKVMESGNAASPVSGKSDDGDEPSHVRDSRFIDFAKRFDVANLSIDMIDAINPFQLAYEVLSKSVSASMLKTIHDAVRATRIEVTEQEAVLMYDEIKAYVMHHRQPPSPSDINPKVARMGEIYIWLEQRKRKLHAEKASA